ncbi:MAG: LCP family protein [Peptococcaceae bacterium]|jgi:LCP family protein required for cell wall assembly|nr:LCP family protein [Peptococcaceae bacterium]
MRKSTLFKTAVVLAAVLCLGYLAFDRYFRLPYPKTLSEKRGQGGESGAKPEFDRFNVLVLGLDGRQGVNDRADTIILASLDGEKKEAQLLSIPRDTRVRIKGSWDKVNAAYAYGGVELTKKTLSDFLDVEIDRYVLADFKSLVKLVDELGGIEVDVPVRMYVPLEGIDLQPGRQHLNGEQVLAYTRFRGTSEGDIGRVKRQQQVITLLAEKVLKAQNLAKLPQFISIFQKDVKTDLTVKEMGALARIAPEVLEKGISTCVLPGENKKIDGLWYWEPDMPALRELLAIPLSTAQVARK